MCLFLFFFQAEDGIRDLVRSRGLGDVYKRQQHDRARVWWESLLGGDRSVGLAPVSVFGFLRISTCLLYTSDAADERSSVDLGGRRIIKKKTDQYHDGGVVGSSSHAQY